MTSGTTAWLGSAVLWLATGPCGAAGWQDTHVSSRGLVPAIARVTGGLVPLVAIVVAVATLLIAPSSAWLSSGAESLARLLGLAAGAGILTVGAAIWVDGSAATRGGLAILAGLAFVAPAWEAWASGPPLIRSLSAAVQPFFLPLVAHLVLSGPTGRIDRRAIGAGVVVGYWARRSRRSRSR